MEKRVEGRRRGRRQVSLYKRGEVWWYKFRFAGQVVRESSKSESKTVAKDAERARHRELEGSFNRISRPRTAQLFATSADAWLSTKIAHLSPRSVIIERANPRHINPYFGKMLLCDIVAGVSFVDFMERRGRRSDYRPAIRSRIFLGPRDSVKETARIPVSSVLRRGQNPK